MRRPMSRSSRFGERGATAVFVALTVAVLGGFLALAINVGHLYTVRAQLQNASDSGALAGAQALNGKTDGLDPAVALAGQFASLHDTDSTVQVVASAIELGRWTPTTQPCAAWGGVASGQTGPAGYQFCRIDGRDSLAALRINAVRVQTMRAAGAPGGGAAPVFMSGLLGAGSTANVGTEAVAVSGGPCQEVCPTVPLVIRAGCLLGPDALRCGQQYTLGLSAATIDTAGWTLFNSTNPNSNGICTLFKNGTSNCNLSVGETIATGNGNNLSATCRDPGTSGTKTLCDWFKRYVGSPVQVPVVDYNGGGACSGGYQGTGTVAGFATLQVTAVVCASGTAGDVAGSPCAPYATGQCIAVQLLCDQKDQNPNPPGCDWFGTGPLRRRLVR